MLYLFIGNIQIYVDINLCAWSSMTHICLTNCFLFQIRCECWPSRRETTNDWTWHDWRSNLKPSVLETESLTTQPSKCHQCEKQEYLSYLLVCKLHNILICVFISPGQRPWELMVWCCIHHSAVWCPSCICSVFIWTDKQTVYGHTTDRHQYMDKQAYNI